MKFQHVNTILGLLIMISLMAGCKSIGITQNINAVEHSVSLNEEIEQTATHSILTPTNESTIIPTLEEVQALSNNMYENEGNLINGNFLTNNPCTAPCFWNIHPGVSTRSEAEKIFSDIGLDNNCKYFDNLSKGGGRCSYCDNIGVYLDENNIVLSVVFSPFQEISLEVIVQYFGEPDSYSISSMGINDSEPYDTVLLFNSANLVAFLPEQKSKKILITENIKIETLIFSDDKKFDRYQISCKPWRGYGEYLYSFR